MLRREAVRDLDGFVERAHQHDGAVAARSTSRATGAVGSVCKLPLDFRGHRLRPGACDVVSRMAEASTSCSACASMSAASHARIAVGGDDQDLGRPGDEVDPDFAREQLLGGRDVDVAGADDAVDARHGRGAEGERRDGLRAAHLKDVRRRPAGAPCPESPRTGCGQATQMFGTPATCAGITVISSVEGSG